MSEFGHTGIIGSGFCLDSWGSVPFIIEIRTKRYSFEDSDRFGPLLLGRDGEPLNNQPGDKHPFWIGYTPWRHQGRKIENGLCVWEPFIPDKVRLIIRKRKRFIEMIEAGNDPDGSFVVVETINEYAT